MGWIRGVIISGEQGYFGGLAAAGSISRTAYGSNNYRLLAWHTKSILLREALPIKLVSYGDNDTKTRYPVLGPKTKNEQRMYSSAHVPLISRETGYSYIG